MQGFNKFDNFQDLSVRVQGCRLCYRMKNSTRILGLSSGPLDAKVMLIGEAPGRLGADSTGIPFHGDQSGNNFENLLDFVGISRMELFITNAVLCNPKDDKGNNATPTTSEANNCSSFLKEQIDLINPSIVATLGLNALKATSSIESHNLTLKENVRTKNKWYGRFLIPLYHPGQRAMIHRSLANQRSDYQFLFEQLSRVDTRKRQVYGKTNIELANIVKIILEVNGNTSYFVLHKLFYLIEFYFFEEFGVRLTNAYFIRQKDGPYCTDLHIKKLKNTIKDLQIRSSQLGLMLSFSNSLFKQDNCLNLSRKKMEFIIQKIEEFGNKTEGKIKSRVYLTKPMKKILIREKKENINMYNVPIQFD